MDRLRRFGITRIIAGIFLVAGALLTMEELPLQIPGRTALAAVFFGAAIIAGFLENVIPGIVHPGSDDGYYFEGSIGWGARLWGILLVSLGAAVLAGGVVEWLFPGFLEGRILGTPLGQGSLMVMAGTLLLLRGVLYLLGQSSPVRWLPDSIYNLSNRLLGGAALLLASGLICTGLLRMAAPDLLTSWISQVIPPLPTPPIP